MLPIHSYPSVSYTGKGLPGAQICGLKWTRKGTLQVPRLEWTDLSRDRGVWFWRYREDCVVLLLTSFLFALALYTKYEELFFFFPPLQ